ncbi:hypothetical protein AG0111_0g4072 [Alternaria gaisen]|uniref:Uncharacterized protein n=1 Tax=Alternaria gaisen TaxID=167740 RepID=A0ACB6FSJ1_9PLEO|nr:hypothetical protein AG0111_0g4072 [Alternaria gaisen]
MGTCRGKGCQTGGREDSPLFYTPPPVEKPTSSTSAFENDSDDAENTGFSGPTACGRTLYCTQEHAHVAQSCSSRIPDPFLPSLSGSEVSNLELKSLLLGQQTSHDEQDLSRNMSLTGRSLTSFDDTSSCPAKHRNHPSGDKPHKFLYTGPVSPRSVPPSISTIKPRPTQYSQSSGQLAGYSTSGEDKLETNLIRGAKKGRPKKAIVYKSSKFVASDSSESGVIRPPSHQVRSSRTTLARSKRLEDPDVNTVPHLASPSKLADQTRKTKNMTAKRRINTRGGFVMDSESDEEESDLRGHDDNNNQSRSSTRQKPYALEPPHSIQANSRRDSSAKPLPTKQLNKSRLNKLLGRVKGASTTSRQEQSLVHTQSPITTTPAFSTWNSHLTASLGLQQSAVSLNSDRAKCSATADTMKEVKVPGQQAKVVGSSMTKTDGNVSSVPRKIPPTNAVVTGRTSLQTSSVSTPPTTAATGPSSNPLSRQRKLVPGANIARERKNGMSDNKTSLPTQPRSLLQLTLDEAKMGTMGSTPGAQPQVSDKDERNIARGTVISTTSAGKSVSIPQPCVKKHDIMAANAKSKQCSSSKSLSPKASEDPASQREECHIKIPDPCPRKFTPGASKANASSSKPAPSTPRWSAQKRKLDSISGGSNRASTAARKKPTSALEPQSKRPETIQAVSLVDASSRSSAVPKTIVRKTPAEATAKKAAINNPVEKSRISEMKLLSRAKSFDRPEDFAAVSTNSNLSKPSKSTRHSPVAPDTATLAQHNNASNRVVKSSSGINASLEQLAANKHGGAIQGPYSTDKIHKMAVTPYPEKALSLSANVRSKKMRQSAESGIGIHEQHGPISASSPAKAYPVLAAEPIFSATRKESLSSSSMTVPEPVPSNESQLTDLAEPAVLEAGLPVSTQTIEDVAMHSGERPTNDIEMDFHNVRVTAIVAQRDTMSADTVAIPRAANSHDPPRQFQEPIEITDGFPLTNLSSELSKHMIPNAPKIALTPSVTAPVCSLPSLGVATDSEEDVLHLSGSPQVCKEAQPYFEYSVVQKVWSSEQTEESIAATETTVRPFTSIVEANAQAEKTFQNGFAHSFDPFFESRTARDEHGCSILTGSATPFDNPIKKIHFKIWVQRDIVSKFANQTPQTLKATSFISSTCYILRLFNLAEQADTEGSDASDSEDSDSPACEPVRVYQSHSRPEIYTTLNAANRAARALQIELSHEREPKDEFSRAFQEKNLKELDTKLRELQSRELDDGNDGCWKGKFNACGLGADTLEVVVEKTSICGARNL